MSTLRLLAISGAHAPARGIASWWTRPRAPRAARGAQVESLDLRSLALPLYDADLEKAAGCSRARRLRDAARADGVLLSAPEYNGFPTPL